MAGAEKSVVETADEHVSCPTMQAKQEDLEEPEMEPHCNADSEPAPAQHHSNAEESEPVAFAIETVSPLGVPCTHCLAPSTPVPAPLNLANDKSAKRFTDLLKPNNFRTFEIPLPIVPARVCKRSGAPPGNSVRSYILHNTFLI
jgi:hypothetical protein